MARLWTCGFETQSATLELGVASGSVVGGTTPDISTTVHRRGTAALRVHPAANTSYIEHQLMSGTVVRTFHRFYLRIDALPDVDTNIYSIGQSGYFPCSVRLTATGALVIRDGYASVTLAGATGALTLGRWYRVEVDYTDVAGTIAAGTSPVRAYLDGAQFCDAMCSNINGFSRVRVGVSGVAATCDLYIDDVAVNDSTGTAQNGVPGPGCVVHLLPNAAGDNSLFETGVGGTSGAANNWSRVAERTPDDSTSYNQTSATGTTTVDDFNLMSAAEAGIGTADQITCVQVGARVSSDAVTTANLVYRLKSQAAGAVAESASVPVNNTTTAGAWSTHRGQSPRPYQLTSYTDPQDGSAWTPARLDTAQVGYRSNVSQTTVRRVTSVWALVEFVPRFALGTATEWTSSHELGYEQSATPTADLVDDFNDNTVDTLLWPNSFGTYSETGGRARVAVDTGYNAFSSAKAYRLKDSRLTFQIFPPALPDGSTEAWAQVLVKSNVEGTDLGFEVNIGTGTTVCFVRTGYWDPEGVYLTYDATAHAWMRIHEVNGQVLWDTSPDGHNWVNRRTVASPAWVADGDLEVQMIAHRTDGPDNFVEYDNMNVLPAWMTSVGTASVRNQGRPLTARKRSVFGSAATTQAAHSLRVVKRRAVGLATTRAAASRAIPHKTRELGPAASAVSATAPRAAHRVSLLSGDVVTSGYGLGPSKTRPLDTARTADLVSPTVARKRGAITAALAATEGHAVRAARIVSAGRAAVVDTAHQVTPTKSGAVAQAVAADVAHPVLARKSRVVGAASTEGVSHGLRAVHRYSVPVAGSQATGWPVVARSRAMLGAAPARETAHELEPRSRSTLGHSVTTTRARQVAIVKGHLHESPARSTDVGHPTTVDKRFHLGTAHQADAARPPAGSVKTLRAGAAVVAHSGAGVDPLKRSSLGLARLQDAAASLSVGKTGSAGTAHQATTGRPVTWRRTAHLVEVSTSDLGHALTAHKVFNLVNSAVANHAAGVAVSKARPLGRGALREAGLDVRPLKTIILGVAYEADETHGVALPVLNRMLRTAPTTDTVHPITVYKPRPADTLVPGWTEPGLTPGTQSSGLQASVNGPTLTAETTTGGS